MKITRSGGIIASIIGFSFLVLLILAGYFIIPEQIRKKLETENRGPYQLKIGSIKASLISQSITLKHVTITDSLETILVQVEKIKCTGIDFFKLIKGNGFTAKKLVCISPDILINQNFKFRKKQTDKNQTKDRMSLLIERLQIKNARLCIVDSIHRQDSLFYTHFQLTTTHTGLHQETAQFRYKSFSTDQLNLQLDDAFYLPSTGEYRLQLSQLDFSLLNKQINIHQFRLVPRYGKYEMGNRKGFQSDWFIAAIDSIRICRINLESLLFRNTFSLGSVHLKGVNFEAFKDRRLPFPSKPDTKLLPDLVQAVPVPFSCDSVITWQTNIRYSERVDKSERAGYVDLSELSAVILNVGNQDSLLQGPMTITARANVMGQAWLTAKFDFGKPVFQSPYQVHGHLDPINFSAFNPMTKPNMAMEAQKGRILKLSFSFCYTNNQANGILNMDYRDLKMNFINRDNKNSQKVKSLLANSIMLNSNNLPDDKNYREGTINFTRDRKRSFFNYWWKSVSTGIESITVNVKLKE